MERIFVDTSAWLSYANRNDADHRRVKRALTGFPGRLVTSNFVFDETVTLCGSRLGHAFALLVGDTLQDVDTVDLVRVSVDDEARAWARGIRPTPRLNSRARRGRASACIPHERCAT